MQAITVAVSPKGTAYFNNYWVLGVLATALKQPSSLADHNVSSQTIGSYMDRKNLRVSLTKGTLSGFSPKLTSFAQQNNGTFQLVFTGSNLSLKYEWNETYDYRYDVSDLGTESWERVSNGPLEFIQQVPTLTCTVTVGFRFNSSPAPGAWEVDLVDPKPTAVASGISSPTLPQASVLVWSKTCLDMHIGEVEAKAISGMVNNFSAEIQNHFPAVFASIPASGKLTDSIKFDFGLGSSGLVFPNDNKGIKIGATGTATWNGTVYPGTNPPELELPPVPADHHLNYRISDYSINAVFWAFYRAGLLETVATQANTGGNSSVLTTNTFRGSPAHAIYDKYPNVPMTATITALSAPTVALKSVYEPTEERLEAIRPKLPKEILAKLQGITSSIYVSESAFCTDLVNYLGQADADQYKTILERSVQEVAAVVTHSNRVIMNVLVTGNPVTVLTLDISETDTLEQFVLGHNEAKTTQTLQFVPSVIPELTNATFVSSPLRGIDVQSFGYIYNLALQPVFAAVATAVGKAGVALPRIKGFNFLFDKATIDLEQGYASVLTDVMHANDNGVLYFQSKRRIQPGEPIVWPAIPRKNRSAPPPKRPLPPVPAEWPSLNQSE